MYKKIIIFILAIAVIATGLYFSGINITGSSLTSSAILAEDCTQAKIDEKKNEYEANTDKINTIEEYLLKNNCEVNGQLNASKTGTEKSACERKIALKAEKKTFVESYEICQTELKGDDASIDSALSGTTDALGDTTNTTDEVADEQVGTTTATPTDPNAPTAYIGVKVGETNGTYEKEITINPYDSIRFKWEGKNGTAKITRKTEGNLDRKGSAKYYLKTINVSNALQGNGWLQSAWSGAVVVGDIAGGTTAYEFTVSKKGYPKAVDRVIIHVRSYNELLLTPIANLPQVKTGELGAFLGVRVGMNGDYTHEISANMHDTIDLRWKAINGTNVKSTQKCYNDKGKLIQDVYMKQFQYIWITGKLNSKLYGQFLSDGERTGFVYNPSFVAQSIKGKTFNCILEYTVTQKGKKTAKDKVTIHYTNN